MADVEGCGAVEEWRNDGLLGGDDVFDTSDGDAGDANDPGGDGEGSNGDLAPGPHLTAYRGNSMEQDPGPTSAHTTQRRERKYSEFSSGLLRMSADVKCSESHQ